MPIFAAMVAIALAGVGIAMRAESLGLGAVPGYAFAAITIAGLAALYWVASFSTATSPDEKERRLWPVLALIAVTVGAILALRSVGDDASLRNDPAVHADKALSAVDGPVAVRIRRSPDSRFMTQGTINGADITLVIDTGASTVMMKTTDAERAGIDVANLAFDTPFETANGTAYAAAVRLRQVGIGLLSVRDVEALVVKPGNLNESLLGSSFLRRLASYDISGDFMTLRK